MGLTEEDVISLGWQNMKFLNPHVRYRYPTYGFKTKKIGVNLGMDCSVSGYTAHLFLSFRDTIEVWEGQELSPGLPIYKGKLDKAGLEDLMKRF